VSERVVPHTARTVVGVPATDGSYAPPLATLR